jgi:HTH-type transcriptional regulator, competence development regulator
MKTNLTQEGGKSLGAGLRTARELRNLSLREVEEATGISNAYLSQLENDKIKKPSPHFLHRLAALYEIEYQVLMEAAGYIKKNDGERPRTLAGAALRSLGKLTPEEEEQVADYVAYLRSKRK